MLPRLGLTGSLSLCPALPICKRCVRERMLLTPLYAISSPGYPRATEICVPTASSRTSTRHKKRPCVPVVAQRRSFRKDRSVTPMLVRMLLFLSHAPPSSSDKFLFRALASFCFSQIIFVFHSPLLPPPSPCFMFSLSHVKKILTWTQSKASRVRKLRNQPEMFLF